MHHDELAAEIGETKLLALGKGFEYELGLWRRVVESFDAGPVLTPGIGNARKADDRDEEGG